MTTHEPSQPAPDPEKVLAYAHSLLDAARGSARNVRVEVVTRQTDPRTLPGVLRAVTDERGNFFPPAGAEYLWLTSTFEHFVPVSDVLSLQEVRES